MLNMFNQTDQMIHKAIMDFSGNSKKANFFGISKVPFTIYGDKIFKAIVDSVPANTNPLTDIVNWEEFSGAGGGTESVGGDTLLKVVYVSSNTTVDNTGLGSHYVADTSSSNVELTLPADASLDGRSISVENSGSHILRVKSTSSWKVEFVNELDVLSGEFYTFTVDANNSLWKVTTKEVGSVIGDVSHLVGFFDVAGSLMVDIIPLSDTATFDIQKYNLNFKNGSRAYVITTDSVEVVVNELLN